MNRVWLGLKGVLSAVLVAIAALAVLLSRSPLTEPAVFGIAAVLVFFAALLWVDFTMPSRAMALAGVVFSFAFLFLAARVLASEAVFPHCVRGS